MACDFWAWSGSGATAVRVWIFTLAHVPGLQNDGLGSGPACVAVWRLFLASTLKLYLDRGVFPLWITSTDCLGGRGGLFSPPPELVRREKLHGGRGEY